MKKTLIVLIAAVAISFAGGSPAAAQVATTTVVKVPFSFIAGERVLPAGTYRISPITLDWAVVAITNLDEKQPDAAFVQTIGMPAAGSSRGDARFTFRPFAGHQFLEGIAIPGRDSRQIVVTPASAERTLAKLNLMNAEPAAPAK